MQLKCNLEHSKVFLYSVIRPVSCSAGGCSCHHFLNMKIAHLAQMRSYECASNGFIDIAAGKLHAQHQYAPMTVIWFMGTPCISWIGNVRTFSHFFSPSKCTNWNILHFPNRPNRASLTAFRPCAPFSLAAYGLINIIAVGIFVGRFKFDSISENSWKMMWNMCGIGWWLGKLSGKAFPLVARGSVTVDSGVCGGGGRGGG